MIPYQPDTKPMTGEEQKALMDILAFQEWGTYGDRLRTANTIIAEGFARRTPRKLTRLQLWSYFIETVLLIVCAVMVHGVPGLGFVYGALMALSIGSLLTWVSGLIINAGIDKGALK